jgi:uncharacterized protein (TIGR03083 family)
VKDPAAYRDVQPVETVTLFPDLLAGLLDLTASLTADQWAAQVPRKRWTVKDVALHLLGGDVGILSRARDGYAASTSSATDHAELVAFITQLNDSWVQAAQRISPELLGELLLFTGTRVDAYFRSLDPAALGERVSWVGPDPAPNWMGIAREYTERWHHQQHMREATARAGFTEPRFLAPALDTFVRALPYAYRGVAAREGTVVELMVTGDGGGIWSLLRDGARWRLFAGQSEKADAAVSLPQEIAWRLWTKWFPRADAVNLATVRGDVQLAEPVFDMTSVIA